MYVAAYSYGRWLRIFCDSKKKFLLAEKVNLSQFASWQGPKTLSPQENVLTC